MGSLTKALLSEKRQMPKDITTPISVSSLGVCPDLEATALPEDPFTDGTYTMMAASTVDLPAAIQEQVSEDHVILVVSKGSLAKHVSNGFSGFFPNYSYSTGPILDISGFILPTYMLEKLIKSGLQSGSLPVVFADEHGNTYAVRYRFDLDCLFAIQKFETI